MSDENNKLIQLAGLGNVSDEEIRKNIEGKPKPVEQEESDVLDLGVMNDFFFKDEDGTLKVDNPYDAQLGVDFDQFKSQGNFLGFNRVTGLDDQFTYTGIDDVYNRSQEAQGSIEKMRNGIMQFVGDTGINVAQGFATLLYGVPSAIANGDFTNIYDNSVANALDTAQEKYDKYFDIKHGGDQSLTQRATNFLFDDFLGGVSFVVGAIATEAAMTAATVGTGGAAASAQAAATAGLVARGSRLLKNVVTGGKRVISGQIVDDAVRGLGKLSSTATAANASAALRSAGQQALTRQGLNAAGKLTRQIITGAGMEAGMEARHMMNAAGEENKREYEMANGAGSYTPEMEEAFREEISGYGDAAFALNTALVAGSNIIMFPKLFGVGVRKGMQTSKFIDTSKLSTKAREKLAKRLGVEVGDLPKMIDAARGTRMGRNLRRLTPGQSVGATMFYEGFVEEGGQGTISRSFEDYIADKYDPANMRDTENMVSSITKGLMGSYGTAEGLKEVAIGMMLGGLGVPNVLMANQYKETGPDGTVTRPAFVGGFTNIRRAQAEQDARMDRIIKLAEKDGDVLTQTQAEIANSNIQRGLARAMDVHVNNNDMKRAKDVESDSIFAHATSKIITGRFEDAIEESREILEGMSVEEMREHLGPMALDMTDAEIRQHKTKVHDTYVQRMNEAREAYRQAREVYRGEDTDVHESIAKLLFDVKNRDIREKYLADSIAEKIKTLSGEQVMDASRIQQRLKVTDRQLAKLTEIENALAEEESSPESEERANRIVKLQAEKDALLATLRGSEVESNYDYDVAKFNADLEALVDYYNAQQQLGAEVQDWEQSDLQEVVKDLREIQDDRKALIDAYNDLLEPGGYARMTARLRERVLARFEEEEEDMAVAADEQVLRDLEEEESADVTPDTESVGGRPGPDVSDVGAPPGADTDVMFPDMAPPDDVGAPPGATPADVGAPPAATDDVGAPPARPQNGEDVAPQEPPAAPPAPPTAQEEAENNAEQGEPGTMPGTYKLRVQPDDADMSGEVNKFHKEGSEDLVENGAAVGEEVTISRGTIVKDGVAINALEFSLRGNVISRVEATTGENARIYSLLTTPVVGRVNAVERSGMGTRIAQPQDVTSVLTKPGQIAEIGFYTKRGGRTAFRQLLDPEASSEAVTVEAPAFKTTQPKTGKPYVYIKDSATGQMVWHPAETKPIGTRMAQAILYIERAHAIVESGGEIKFHGMTLEQAQQTMNNFQAAYGINPNLRGKEKAKQIKQIIESFMILDNRDVSDVLDAKADTTDRLMYFPSDYRGPRDQPGITLFRKDLNAKGNRIRIRSQYITAPQDETRFVNSLARMRYNVSLQHVGSEGIFSNMQVNKDGIVEFGQPVTVRRHYANVLKFTERRPLMVNDKPYSDFIRNMDLDLSQLTEVPTEPTQGPGRGSDLTLPDEIRDTLDALGIDGLDNLLMGTEFTESDPMYRAGRLYEVEGLTNKEVSEALNMLTGRLAERMLRHSRTKERRESMVAADMMRQIGNDLKDVVDKAEAVLPQLDGVKAEKLGQIINAYKQVLEPAKYDKLMQLTFMEAMRISRGVIELRGGSIGEALQNMMDDTAAEIKSTQRDQTDEEVLENPMAAFDDNFAFGVDPKSTMRLETKLALMTVQYTEANATTTGMFGKKYIDFNTLTHQLNATLAGVDYEWSAVKMVLQDAISTYPHFQVVLDLMDAEAATGQYAKRTREVTLMMQKQFVVFAAKDLSIFDALIVTPRGYATGSNIQQFSSNARNMEEFAKATAEMRFVDFGFYNEDGTVNTDKVQDFLDKMEKIAEMYPMQHREAAKAYSQLFAKELGLRIPAEALTEDNKITNRTGEFMFAGIDTDLLNHSAANSIFGSFRDALRDVVKGDVDMAITDPGNQARKPIEDFLVATARYQDNFIQNTSVDASNKLRWHYSAPKHVSKLLRQLLHEELNPLDWTLEGNRLLQRMRIPGLRNFVKMTYVDGIKTQGMRQVRDFHGMDMHDKAIARLSYYMNNNNQLTISYKGTRKVQLVKHMLPTLADKHTMPMIEVPSLNLSMLQVREGEDVNVTTLFDLQEAYDKTVRGAIDMERKRILAIQRGTGDVFDSLTATQKKAKRFTVFPTLDPQLVADPDALHREAQVLFERHIATEYTKMINLLQDSGVVDLNEGLFNYFDPSLDNYAAMGAHFGYDVSEIEEDNAELKELIYKAFIGKYVIEAFDFNLNATTMLVGDPGSFGGATKMGKRFAALIAPGNVIPRVSWQKTVGGKSVKRNNHRVRALVLPDRVVTKAVHEDYLKRIGLNEAELAMYSGYESADGAEYTTAEEHLSILYAQGKITQAKMQKILSKANAGTLSQKEREVFFQPMKPVTVEKLNGHLLYIKSASFPLVAGLTKGTELDKLRVFMEENNIQRAVHTSGLKVGNPLFEQGDGRKADQTMKAVYDDNGDISMEAVEQFRDTAIDPNVKGALRQVIEYDRTSMRIQQEVPSSELGEKVHGSQVAKLVLANMADDETLFTMNGKPGVTGREMHRRYMEAREIEIMAKISRFADRYGLTITEDGTLLQGEGYGQEIAKRLYEEGVKRNYDVNELEHLHYDIENGAFSTPLTQGPSASRVESLMLSLLRSEIMNPKMYGFGGPIRPETGLRYEKLEDMDQSDIRWVTRDGKKLYDGKRLKVSQEGRPNQIIMPWKYRAKIPVVDGVVKAEDLPAEMLQAMAYRIPGQKKGSSATFEIVGFLPKSYGDTLIVPEELIGQIGQDYDIDKMYGFLFEPTEIDGELIIDKDITAEGFNELDDESKIRVAHNQMVEIYNQSLLSTDPNASLERHRPVTDGYSEELAQLLGTAATAPILSPFGVFYNDRKADTARSAKKAIGVFASQNVLHSQVEQAIPGQFEFWYLKKDFQGKVIKNYSLGVEIRIDPNTPMTTNEDFKYMGLRDIHDTTFLLDYETPPTAGTRQEQFSVLLNHAVDNENNQLLGMLNINASNWAYWSTLTHMGYNMETIALFMNTPYMKAVAKDQENGAGLVNRGGTDYASTMLTDARKVLKDERKRQGKKSDKKLQEWKPLDKRTMLDVIQGKSTLTQVQEAVFIVQLAHAHHQLDLASDGLMTLQNMMKHDTKNAKTRAALELDMYNGNVFRKVTGLDGQSGLRATDPNTMELLTTDTVSGQLFETLERVRKAVLDIPGESVYRTGMFEELVSTYGGMMGEFYTDMTSRKAGEALARYLVEVRRYLNAKWIVDITGKTTAQVRAEMLSETNGMAQRLVTLRSTKEEVRDNLFIKQLIPMVNPKEGYSRIEFTGDRVINVSPIEMHGAFLALARSEDAQVRQLAEDLVVYGLLLGGSIGARSYNKYIPAAMLQQLGIRDAVGTGAVEYMMFDGGSIMHEQIVRHAPELAPKLNAEYAQENIPETRDVIYGNEATKKVIEFGYVRVGRKVYKIGNTSFNNEQGMPIYRLTEMEELGDYFSAEYAPDTKGYTKTMDIKQQNEGDGRMPPMMAPIGGFEELDGPPSMVDENFGDPAGRVRPGVQPESEVEDTDGPNVGNIGDIGAPPVSGRPGRPIAPAEESEPELRATYSASEYADKFVKGSSNVLRQLLEFEKRMGQKQKVRIVIVEPSQASGAKANYRNDGNHILYITKGKNNKGVLTAQELAHELIHAHTVQAMDNPSPQMKETVERLDNLRKQITASPELLRLMGLDIGELNLFKEGVKVFKRVASGTSLDALTEAERQAYDFVIQEENQKRYYGLYNTKEFVAEAMSNPQFQQGLNNIKLNKNETFLDRVVAYFSQMLSDLGIIADNQTALEEVAALTMNMIVANAKQRGVTIKKSKKAQNDKPPGDVDNMLLNTDVDNFGLKDNTLQAFRDYKEKRIRELKEMRSRYRDNKVLVQRMNQRIGLEERDLELLADDSVGLQDLVAVADRELRDARAVLDNAAGSQQDMRFVQSALENVSTITEFYANMRGIVKESREARASIDEMVREASVLREDYFEEARELSRKMAREHFKGTKGVDYINEDTFERVEDTTWFSSLALDATRQGSMELNFLDGVMRDAAADQRAQFNRRSLRFLKKSKAFKQTDYYKKHKWEGMVQLDTAGNPTPQLIHAFSGKWEAELARAQKRYRKQPKLMRAWLAENTDRIDVNTLYDYSGDTLVRKNNPAAIALLEKKYGKLGAEEFLERQDKLMENYVFSRTAEFDIIETTVDGAEARQAAKDEWVQRNDPSNKSVFNRFLFNMPKKAINGKKTGYYDARFVELQKDPAAVEFYREYRQQMIEMMHMLPVHKMGDAASQAQMQNGLFIPAIRKSFTKEIIDGGMSQVGGRLTDAMLRAMTVTEEDNMAYLIDPVTGRQREELPVNFMNKLADPSKQDYDLERTFLGFAMMATTYESKNKIEDTVRMTRSLMGNINVTPKIGMSKLRNKLGMPLSSRTADDRSKIMRSVNALVNRFYGHKTTADVQRNAPRSAWPKDIREEIEKLEQQMSTADTLEEKQAIQDKIDAKTPKVSVAKTTYGIQQWIQAKGMGWNLPAAATNMVYGTLAGMQYAAGQREFNETHYRRGLGLMMNSVMNSFTLNYAPNATARKIQGMMTTLDVLKDFTEIRFQPGKFVKSATEAGLGAAGRKGLRKLGIYELQRSSEYLVYGSATIALLQSIKVDGKTLWEAMDENGIIQLEGYRPGEAKHKALMAKVDQVNKRIHGNYDPNSPMPVKATMIGPLLMQFKSWLPEAIAQRVQTERYDPLLDRNVKGRWNTMAQMPFTAIKAILPRMIPILNRKMQFDDTISEVDQENLRKSAANFRQMMYLYIFIKVLEGMLDDDDDDKSLNFVMNIANRVDNDLGSFLKPAAFQRLVVGANSLAIFGAFTDLQNFAAATGQTLAGDDTIPTGVYAGKYRMLHHGGKLIPHSAAIQKLANNLDRIMELR